MKFGDLLVVDDVIDDVTPQTDTTLQDRDILNKKKKLTKHEKTNINIVTANSTAYCGYTSLCVGGGSDSVRSLIYRDGRAS